MSLAISIDGESVENENLIDEDTVSVQIYLDESDETLCTHCGESIAEYPGGWLHDNDDSRLCKKIDFDDVRRELELDDDAEVTEDMIRADTEFTLAEPRAKTIHDYVNWVGAQVKEDSVEVQISVGEPRGCFTLELRPVEDDNGNVQLYLYMPYQGQQAPHVPIEHVADGTFILRPKGLS
jgi:hypothetical protein